MSSSPSKKRDGPRGNISAKFKNPEVEDIKPTKNGNSQFLCYSDRFLLEAEIAARQLIRSWCDYGPKQVNEIDLDMMPGILPEVARRVLDAMLNHEARGFEGVYTYFIDAPPGIRNEFCECNQEYSPRPQDCSRLIEIIRDYHHAQQRDIITDKLIKAQLHATDSSDLLREFAKLEAEAQTTSQAFPIERAGLSEGLMVAQDFVEGLLTEGGASVLYGPSNCGKSFWILDLAVCVATGVDFRDELGTDLGAVVYVALEGSFGVRNRIEALKQTCRITDLTPLFLCFAPMSLLETGHAAKLAASVKKAAEESKLPCRLVILDTLARAMAGGDENAGKDMTAAVASIDAVRAATGAHVCVVHHCGKDEARGARGHSSLRAAVDSEIEISRQDGQTISTVRVTKQRDMPIGEPMPFSLVPVTLGTDRRGKPITSCVVRHEDSIMANSPRKAGRKPKCTADDLLRYLPADTVDDWLAKVIEGIGIGKSSFYAHKTKLEKETKIRCDAKTNRLIQA